MAKDPAMLWYWSDWNSGTAILNRFLKGCYMDLLHAQFNSGHLSLAEIKMILGNDFAEAWPILQKKFKTDDDGNFFNERLEIEKTKRANFTATRRKNLEGKPSHMDTHMGQLVGTHTGQRMENENINRIIDEVKDKGVQGEKEKLFAAMFSDEIWLTEINRLHSKKNIPEAWSECYIYHKQQPRPPEAVWEWRQKLNTWLINKKPEKEKQYDHGKNGKVRNPTAKSFGTL